MILKSLEPLLLKSSRGVISRFRILFYKLLGLKVGVRNRMEAGRCRRLSQINIGEYNAFSHGFQLWPEDAPFSGIRIQIGNRNYFNRNLMIDACGTVEIGNENLFGPDVYITDSNHAFEKDKSMHELPMSTGKVSIGNHCWIGAKAIILKDVDLGDHCVVAAGAVVTKSFPSGSIVAGVPAKIIKTVF